jgi:hypothetical protein
MDESIIVKLLDQAQSIYGSATGCMPGLQRWSESFGDTEEGIFARRIYSFVFDKNGAPSTRVFSIDTIIREDFLKSLKLNLQSADYQ